MEVARRDVDAVETDRNFDGAGLEKEQEDVEAQLPERSLLEVAAADAADAVARAAARARRTAKGEEDAIVSGGRRRGSLSSLHAVQESESENQVLSSSRTSSFTLRKKKSTRSFRRTALFSWPLSRRKAPFLQPATPFKHARHFRERVAQGNAAGGAVSRQGIEHFVVTVAVAGRRRPCRASSQRNCCRSPVVFRLCARFFSVLFGVAVYPFRSLKPLRCLPDERQAHPARVPRAFRPRRR